MTNSSLEPTIFERCQSESRILISLDLDFANLRAYPPNQHSGIVVIRTRSQEKPALVSLIRRLTLALEKRTPEHELWIVEQDRIRFRG